MSKKRGETKMADVMRAVADVAEYDRIAATVPSDVMKEFADALGVSVPTAEEINEPPKPKRYVPPEHSECAAHRPSNRCYTVVVNTTRICTNKETIITRYCSCGWCRPSRPGESRRAITHKDVEIIPHK
jgi:hypothetical protein